MNKFNLLEREREKGKDNYCHNSYLGPLLIMGYSLVKEKNPEK
jgi:hypothetical protein